MIRVLLLDLDGTLIDRVKLWRRCLTGFFAGQGLSQLAGDSLEDLLSTLNQADWLAVAHDLLIRCPDLRRSRAELGLALRDQLMRSATPDPAVNDLIDVLARRYRTAIVTNGSDRLQRAKIAGAGLAGRVEAVFISGRMGVRKPEPEFFRRVLAWARVDPGEVLIVGDSFREDIWGGQCAGLRTCAVGEAWDGWWPVQPDHRIARFTDLPGVLG